MKNKFIVVGLIGILACSVVVAATTISEKKTVQLSQEESQNQSDEYKKYRAEQENKIADNKKLIAELKTKRDKLVDTYKTVFDNKIKEVEKKNNEMNKRILETYKDEGKDKWESFKKEFNHDMDELGHSIKDLFKDNEK